MDPGLLELIEQGDGQDEVAAIIRLRQPGIAPKGIRLVAEFGEIATCRVMRDDILSVRAEESVFSFKSPGLLAAEPEVVITEDYSEEYSWSDERRPPGLTATGSGVVIGIVDWGFDFAHPDFRHADGSTRLLAMWDQTPRKGSRPNHYGYGVIHSAEEINRALATADPYGELGYHPADSDTGRGSHGTHVCGIAAGNGRAGGPMGVAPEADIIFVHSSTWGSRGSTKLGDSVTLLEAIDYISKTAGPRPWVINLSMGQHGEQHDGTTLVEQGLDAVLRAAPGRAICQSTGNYFDRRIHAAGQLRPAQQRTLVWEVDQADTTPNELEVWYSGLDTLEVEIRSPGRSNSKRVGPGERAVIETDGKEVGRIYHRRFEPNNLSNHIAIYLYKGAPAGVWQITLFGKDVVDGRFHAWVERDAACTECQSQFGIDDAVHSSTTGTICNGFRTIAVGARNMHSREREIAVFSSSGPTRDGRRKPDIVAPGVLILAARSAPLDPAADAPLLTRMSGTSMASPFVAGTIALMFEVAPRLLRIEETHNLLLGNTQRIAVSDQDVDRVGSGYCDIEMAVKAASEFDGVAREPMQPTSREVNMNTKSEALTVEALSDQFPFEEDDQWAEDDPPIWNAYIYIVGTDKSGKSDFNVMRKLLQKETTFEYPWVAITYDYKKGESDASKGEIRKSWKKSKTAKAKDETFSMNDGFDIVYNDIQAMAANNQTIRELHILTHSASQAIYHSSKSSNTDDLKAVDKKKFKSAFHKDALVKIHGCHVDKDIRKKIREFCETTDATKRTDILTDLRKDVETSYAFKLAEIIAKPVFATPMGAGAVYSCSYLSTDEDGKRFCIETSEKAANTRRLTVRFFEANYDQIFDRASSEKVFDKTYHMKYKPSLRSLKTLSPVACAKDVPPREAIEVYEYYSEADDDIDEFEYEPYIEPAVTTHSEPSLVECADRAISNRIVGESSSLFAHLLSNSETSQALMAPAMSNSRLLSPAPIFDALAYGKYPQAADYYNRLFEVVALPGMKLNDLQPGDCVLRRALGEGNFGHAAIVVDGALVRRANLAYSGLRPESNLPGLYVHVIDSGPFPHRVEDQFARRLTDEYGRLGYDTLVLRIRSTGRRNGGAVKAVRESEYEYGGAGLEETFSTVEFFDVPPEWASITHFEESVDSVTKNYVETPVLTNSSFAPISVTEMTALGIMRTVASPPAGSPDYEFSMKSRICYPRGSRPDTVAGTDALPVVAIVHGNHDVSKLTGSVRTEIESHRGYEYLQEELAKHGIISMSISTNHANSLGADLRTRAETILANLRILRRLSTTAGHRLENRVNLHNLGLMGHSRGGDAVIKAATLLRGNADFTVRAVCALAPSDLTANRNPDQPKVSHRLTLKSTDNLRLLVLYGSQDGDLTGFRMRGTGFRHYDRATCERTMIFAKGITHNRFNRRWDNNSTLRRPAPSLCQKRRLQSIPAKFGVPSFRRFHSQRGCAQTTCEGVH